MSRYRIHIGYRPWGKGWRSGWIYFLELSAARAYAADIFSRTGKIVAVEACR
jgi:hypothetical protein